MDFTIRKLILIAFFSLILIGCNREKIDLIRETPNLENLETTNTLKPTPTPIPTSTTTPTPTATPKPTPTPIPTSTTTPTPTATPKPTPTPTATPKPTPTPTATPKPTPTPTATPESTPTLEPLTEHPKYPSTGPTSTPEPTPIVSFVGGNTKFSSTNSTIFLAGVRVKSTDLNEVFIKCKIDWKDGTTTDCKFSKEKTGRAEVSYLIEAIKIFAVKGVYKPELTVTDSNNKEHRSILASIIIE